MNDDNNDIVEIVDYDPSWPKLAQQEMQLLKTATAPLEVVVAIEHVGSTAIPGMKAKPIIDLYVGVNDLAKAKQLVPLFEKMDYIYWQDNPNLEKMFFVKGMPPFGEKRTHHIHVVEYNSGYWSCRLLFRDYLRSHPDLALEYEQLKIALLKEFKLDREAYTEHKSDFIKKILRLAGFKDEIIR